MRYQLCHDYKTLEDWVSLKRIDEGAVVAVVALIRRHEMQEIRVRDGERDAVCH